MALEDTIIAITAIIAVILAAIQLYREIKKDRKTTKQMLDHLQALRIIIEENQKSIDAMKEKIQTLEKAVDNKLTTSSVKMLDDYQKSVRERALAVEKEKLEWNKLVGIAKGIGWIIDRIGDD